MSDTTITKPPTAAPTAARPRSTGRPQVSVRPVAVGALNAAVIGASTVVTAGGGLVLAAAGAGVAAVGAAAASRKSGTARANKQARTGTGGGNLFGSPGRSSSSRSGGLPKAGRSSAASPVRASGSGRTAGAGRPAGSKPSPFPRGRGGTGGSTTRTAGRGAGRSSTGTSGFRRAGSKPGSSSRSPLTAGKIAAARHKLANRRQPGPRLGDAIRSATTPGAGGKRPTARQAWTSARRAVTGDNPKRRGPVRKAAAGIGAAGLAAGKAAWDARKRRKKAEAARKAKANRINARQTKGGVNTTVRRPGDTTARTGTQRRPAPRPVPPRQQSGTRPAPATEGMITMAHPLLDISEDFLAAAHKNLPEGMLQVTGEAYVMTSVLQNFTYAMKILFDRAQGHPLHPQIKEMYELVYRGQRAVVTAAQEIAPAIERIHEKELDRLRNPRVNEEMWDRTRNQEAA